MKIGHWQLECRPGEVGANLDRVLSGLDRAAEEGIAVVVRSQRHTEQLIWADLPPEDREADRTRSLASARTLMPQLQQALHEARSDS